MLTSSEAPFLVGKLFTELERRDKKLVTAESCTGGMVASILTRRAGASAFFERGFITYSNDAKQEELGVPATTLKKYGAVSKETAIAMAKGALKNSKADISVSITGIAGPDGGTKYKPVGLVYIATYDKNGAQEVTQNIFDSNERTEIQLQATVTALKQLIKMLQQASI